MDLIPRLQVESREAFDCGVLGTMYSAPSCLI